MSYKLLLFLLLPFCISGADRDLPSKKSGNDDSPKIFHGKPVSINAQRIMTAERLEELANGGFIVSSGSRLEEIADAVTSDDNNFKGGAAPATTTTITQSNLATSYSTTPSDSSSDGSEPEEQLERMNIYEKECLPLLLTEQQMSSQASRNFYKDMLDFVYYGLKSFAKRNLTEKSPQEVEAIKTYLIIKAMHVAHEISHDNEIIGARVASVYDYFAENAGLLDSLDRLGVYKKHLLLLAIYDLVKDDIGLTPLAHGDFNAPILVAQALYYLKNSANQQLVNSEQIQKLPNEIRMPYRRLHFLTLVQNSSKVVDTPVLQRKNSF